MKAIVQNAYGSPAVLELREIDKPVVKDNGVLVRVHAAALHAGDYFIMRGVPYLARFAAGWPKPKDYVPGFDLAGHVEAVGRNVTRFQPGAADWCSHAALVGSQSPIFESTRTVRPAYFAGDSGARCSVGKRIVLTRYGVRSDEAVFPIRAMSAPRTWLISSASSASVSQRTNCR